MRGLIGGVVLVLGLAAPVAAQDWWEGAWAWKPEVCRNVDRIGGAEVAPFLLTRQRFIGYENACEVLAARALPHANAVSLRLSCEGEGTRYRAGWVVMKAGGDTAWFWRGRGEPELRYRCPMGRSNWLERGK